MKKEIIIPAIENGTVIDHIPSKVTFRVMRLLDPKEYTNTINVALNLESKKMGKKGLIKISGRMLTQDMVNKVALLAPSATVSIIKDYSVSKKVVVKVPEMIINLVKCTNPNCITNMEEVNTKFLTIKEIPLKLRCVYCEREISREDIQLK
ncbi:aspartate carbamoyltransferase regulatory subunit [Candidatus Woesearchaeota archaeon]|nr:aspartate carbamoyltransferase regulatory subunit [Candidatus Woesearchaeota archaeon]